jgi:hypothetical protein
MEIPQSFEELLDERIKFCETHLQALRQIPECPSKHESISFFETGLANFTTLKKMSGVVKTAVNPNTKTRYKEFAKAIVAEMLASAVNQMKGINLILVQHRSITIVEGLEKIYREIEAI